MNTINSHTRQMNQFVSYCHSINYALADETAVVSWMFHAKEMIHRKKNTLMAKLQAYKWFHAVVWDRGEVQTGRGDCVWFVRALHRKTGR